MSISIEFLLKKKDVHNGNTPSVYTPLPLGEMLIFCQELWIYITKTVFKILYNLKAMTNTECVPRKPENFQPNAPWYTSFLQIEKYMHIYL